MFDSKEKGDQAEDFVNKIAYSTFLKCWCYPNPLDITKDNKEICDLLVVFDNICIIISVKNYSFNGDYDKYFTRTIDKALRQISGADRKLFGDREIIIKHPGEQIREVFRIIVNINLNVRYYRTSISYDDKHVSLFDAEAWQAMLDELNTISDVISYLRERIRLVSNRPAILLPRQEYDFGESDDVQLATELMRLKEQFNDRLVVISGSEMALIAFYIGHVYQFPEILYITENPFQKTKVST